MNTETIKENIKKTYTIIASQTKRKNESSCCGAGKSCGEIDTTIFSEDYSKEEGYYADADMGVGCGMPVKYSGIKPGDTVVDLGSGAGNDVFVARKQCGESGTVIGVDMTPAMIERAVANNKKLKYSNVEFRLGEIENLPVDDQSADVVISNCVLNLVPDKKRAFQEIHRILKPGGHFLISDIVIQGKLPAEVLSAAELYAGCISGAIEKSEYLAVISDGGFKNVEILSTKTIDIPESILLEYLSKETLEQLKDSNTKVLSITVSAEK